jgi:hypothetical protein
MTNNQHNLDWLQEVNRVNSGDSRQDRHFRAKTGRRYLQALMMSQRSSPSGLARSISSTFHARFHSFIAFSRAIVSELLEDANANPAHHCYHFSDDEEPVSPRIVILGYEPPFLRSSVQFDEPDAPLNTDAGRKQPCNEPRKPRRSAHAWWIAFTT